MTLNLTLIFVFGSVFLISGILLAIKFPNPTPFQQLVFRTVLALSAAGVAAVIPGFIEIVSEIGRTALRAGGALAIFILVYRFNPAKIIQPISDGSKSQQRLAPLGGQQFEDETVNDVLSALSIKHHESKMELLPTHELLDELLRLFNRKTFRFEPLRECVEQNWDDRLHAACQTLKVLRAYERNVKERAPGRYQFYVELLGEVDGYCMRMGYLLFQPHTDWSVAKKHIGTSQFKAHLPEKIRFPEDPEKKPIIPDEINDPLEEHREKAVKLIDNLDKI